MLPKTFCNKHPLENPRDPEAGLVSNDANGSKIKQYGQRRFRVKTRFGSDLNTTWEVADVNKPLISAGRLLGREHELGLDKKPRI